MTVTSYGKKSVVHFFIPYIYLIFYFIIMIYEINNYIVELFSGRIAIAKNIF